MTIIVENRGLDGIGRVYPTETDGREGPPLKTIDNVAIIARERMARAIVNPTVQRIMAGDADLGVDTAERFGERLSSGLAEFLQDERVVAATEEVAKTHGVRNPTPEGDGLRILVAPVGTTHGKMAVEKFAAAVRAIEGGDRGDRGFLHMLAIHLNEDRVREMRTTDVRNAWVMGVEQMIAGRQSPTQRDAETQILQTIGEEKFLRIYRGALEEPRVRDLLDSDRRALGGESVGKALLDAHLITKFDVEDLVKTQGTEQQALLRLGALLIDAHRNVGPRQK